jgi:hypothetical protein
MLQNAGDGTFRDVTVESHTVDALAIDYSVLETSNHDFNASKQRLGIEFHENGKGVAVGDLNGDGYVDLIGTNSNGETFMSDGERAVVGGPLFVWMSAGGDNNWISFRLKGRMAIDGTGSNADGIGAKVTIIHALRGETSTIQVKEVLGSSSFLSMSSLDVHFGLGDADKIAVTIDWPSGLTTAYNDLNVNQIHEFTEPAN